MSGNLDQRASGVLSSTLVLWLVAMTSVQGVSTVGRITMGSGMYQHHPDVQYHPLEITLK